MSEMKIKEFHQKKQKNGRQERNIEKIEKR